MCISVHYQCCKFNFLNLSLFNFKRVALHQTNVVSLSCRIVFHIGKKGGERVYTNWLHYFMCCNNSIWWFWFLSPIPPVFSVFTGFPDFFYLFTIDLSVISLSIFSLSPRGNSHILIVCLYCISKKYVSIRGSDLICFRIGSFGKPLWIQHWTSGFHKP